MNRLVLLLLSSLFAGSSVAAPFQNGSFEIGSSVPCNTFNVPNGSTIITGWTISAGNIDWLGSPPSCGWQPSQGSASLDLVGASAGGIGGIQQTFDTVPGTTYQLSFDLAGNYGAPPVIKPLAVTINGVTSTFTFDTTGRTFTAMGWVTRTITFLATSTSSTVNFVSDVSGSGGTLNAGAALDNVILAPVAVASAPTVVPLDWAQWGAIGAIFFAGFALIRRRRQ